MRCDRCGAEAETLRVEGARVCVSCLDIQQRGEFDAMTRPEPRLRLGGVTVTGSLVGTLVRARVEERVLALERELAATRELRRLVAEI